MANALTTSLTRLLNKRTGKIVRNFGVATPGIVRSFSASSMTCSVQPAVNKLTPSQEDEDDDKVEEYPTLQNVPVLFLAFRGMKVKPPSGALVVGDPVLLVCFDRDTSAWRRTNKVVTPDDARLHDWSSCVAIPGLVPDTSPFTDPTDGAALAGAIATDLAQIAAMLDAAQAGTGFTNTYTAALNTAPLVKARIMSNILKLSE